MIRHLTGYSRFLTPKSLKEILIWETSHSQSTFIHYATLFSYCSYFWAPKISFLDMFEPLNTDGKWMVILQFCRQNTQCLRQCSTICAVLATEYSMFAILLNKLRSSVDRVLNVCDIAQQIAQFWRQNTQCLRYCNNKLRSSVDRILNVCDNAQQIAQF